ncbi:hypothetical protein KR009_007533 [Drosophila setifemur]|nr:hypothetical protein KR009_007533 [Drosophila setifemur]
MAQKKTVATKGKAANGVEKIVATRAAKKMEEAVAPIQSLGKKAKKQPVKEVPPSSEEESDEDQNGLQAEESDSEAEEVAGLIHEEAEEDSDEEDDDNEEDELEPGQVSIGGKNNDAAEEDDSDNDDEAPAEAPISKGGIPKIAVGKISKETPKNQLVFVSNLPTEYKHKDLVALFTKFGPISKVDRLTNKFGANNAIVAFETAAGADAALEARPKALTLDGSVLRVSLVRNNAGNNDRTVVVGLIGPHVTQEDIKAHFEKIGAVEAVNITGNRSHPRAFVRFVSADDVSKALKLHSTELFSRFITVRLQSFMDEAVKTPEHTIIIQNVGKHESYSSDAIEKIFKKIGELNFVDIVCSKFVLAFISFKEPEHATKALNQLNGKTINNLELKLIRFERNTSYRSIVVSNLAQGVNESELRSVFSANGEIESVQMLNGKAIIKFTTDDGFCKSFLLNETIIGKQPVFLEPNSLLKRKTFTKRFSSGAAGPAKFKKFGQNKFGNKPFNKRPAQDNGANQFIKKAKNF